MKQQLITNRPNATLSAAATEASRQPALPKKRTLMKHKPRLNALFTALALLALPAVALAQSDATLASLVPSAGTLAPAFASGTFSYTASVGNATNSMTVTPTATDTVNLPTITVNGISVVSGAASGPISLSVGGNVITTVVVSQDLSTTNTYTLTVTRAGLTYYWDTDGTTAGFGNNAGTWGTSPFWSVTSSGGSPHSGVTATTTNDLVNFGTATVKLGSTAAAVTVSGTVDAGRITFGAAQSNAPVVLTGGTIKLGGTVAVPHIAPSGPSNYTATINSAITLNTSVQINGPNLSVGAVPGTLNLNGVIAGDYGVTFFGPSGNNSFPKIVLGAQNTYTGGTRLHCTGTGANIGVSLGIHDALPTTTVLTLDGPNGSGTAAGRYVRVDLNGFNQTLAGLTTVVRGARRDQCIINSSATPATLTVNNTADYIFTGQLGSGGLNALSAPNFGLTKNGVGKWTLDPKNANLAGNIINLQYTGPTTINNGVLEIANDGQLGNGNYATNITIASGAGLVFSGTRTNALSGVISGDGSLTNSGTGTVTISGTDAVANTVVQNGGVIAIAGGGKVRSLTVGDFSTLSLPGTGAGTVTNLTFANAGTINFNVAKGGALVCPVADGITNNGAAGSITINITGSVPPSGTYTLITYAGSVQGSGTSAYTLGTTPPGSYTLTNTPGAVQLIVVSPVLTWTGKQSSEWSQNAIAGPKNWTLASSPIDYVDGSLVLFDDTTTSSLVDISAADVWPTDAIFNNTTNAYTLQGTYAIGGSTPLTKNGTNTLTILNNNSYSGETTINAGVVQVGNGGTSGVLGYGDINNYGALVFNQSADVTVSQNITGTGTLTKSGTNALTISTVNTCTGDTTVSGGTLILQGTGFSGGARNYSIAAGAVLNLDSTGPAFGTSTISGSGKLLITGQVKNTFATGRRIEISLASSALIEVPLGATLGNGNNSSLSWNNNLAPMSLEGNFELQNVNTVLDALTGSGTIDNPSFGNANQFAATVTVGVAGGSGTFNGPIMNTTATTKISLTKAGTGTQTFTGSLDYRGATTVNAGTMALSGSGSINISPTINVVTNATLDVTGRTDGTLTVNATQTLMGGGTVLGMVNNLGTLAPGASIGTLTISGNLSLDGASRSLFEVDGSTPAKDVVQLGAGVTYGGVLEIVPTGVFTNGQTFTLFSGAGAANPGNFASITGSPGTGKAFSFTNGVLSVVATGPSGPATLTNSVSGGVLSLAWPAGQGWRLESQTNALTVGLGTNWVEAADSSVNSTNITIDTAQPTVFYRLVYP